MNIEQLREFCLSLPHAAEDVKWDNDLCFSVGGKMFAVAALDPEHAGKLSFKCTPEKAAELTEIDGIIPAPYLARYHWVSVQNEAALAEDELKDLISNSYRMIFEKLPPKIRRTLANG